MPEQYYVTSASAADPELASSCALVTDGRFSGASKGPCIGHAGTGSGPLSLYRALAEPADAGARIMPPS